MVVSLIFLFFFILLCAFLMLFFFNFFMPALKIKYDINGTLSSERHSFSDLFETLPEKNALYKARINGENDKGMLNRRMVYCGDKNCKIFSETYGSEYSGAVSCAGFGDCAKKCPQNAIVVKSGTAFVTDMCSGCGKCVRVCPLGLISMERRSLTEAQSDDEESFNFWKSLYKIVRT